MTPPLDAITELCIIEFTGTMSCWRMKDGRRLNFKTPVRVTKGDRYMLVVKPDGHCTFLPIMVPA